MKNKSALKTWFARQGDVYLKKLESLPLTACQAGKDKAVIALGEISGHKHVVKSVKGEVEFYTDNGLTLVSVEQEAELVHEEHEKILLSKGLYMFGVQREVTIYGLVRQVMD